MQYRPLGKTNLQVSLICLGTMTWGEQNTEAEAFAQMDYAVEQGLNFFDTAEMYPVPPRAKTFGRTEEMIGNWFKARGCRDKIILASKIVASESFVGYVRDGSPCLDRKNILAALDGSLKRLGTDYLDLYQLHWPDRITNYFGTLGFKVPQKDDLGTPIEETLAVCDEIVRSGRVRHIGISNETPWGVHQYLKFAEKNGRPRVVSIQNPYNLLNRSFEVGLAEFSYRENMGLLAYSPLGFGFLSGKYAGGVYPAGARISQWGKHYQRYSNDQGVIAMEKYVKLAHDHGLNLAQMALAFVNSRPFLTSTIIGATTMDQLKMNIASIHVHLTPDVLKGIEKIHKECPNPCP